MIKKALIRLVALAGLVIILFTPAGVTAAQTKQVLEGSTLSSGFDMGVNSSGGRTDWLSNEGTSMKMSYPPSQAWGAVFITVGKPTPPPRPSQDFSAFDTLSVDMKGELGNEKLEIGIKTNDQADDGSEAKKKLALTSDWKTYSIPLKVFGNTDLRKLYVVSEFVFSGAESHTVYLRNIRYTNGSLTETQLPLSPLPVMPQVRISYPSDEMEVTVPGGVRPSTSVLGTVGPIPAGWRLYLIVHPTQNDNVWASEINPNGDEWSTTAYLGGADGLASDGSVFEIFAALSQNPLPPSFNTKEVPLQRPSKPVRVTVRVKDDSWVGPYLVPIGGSVITACAMIVAAVIGVQYRRKSKNGLGTD